MTSSFVAGLREEGPEVLYASTGFAAIDDEDIDWLIERARQLPRMRARICFHAAPTALLHEMLIVHHRSAYVRPHRHLRRQETLSVIKGAATAFMFDAHGGVHEIMPIGVAGTGRSFLYRMPAGQFHNMIIESEWLVFLETTTGPFDPGESEFAPWSPDGTDQQAADRFIKQLASHITR